MPEATLDATIARRALEGPGGDAPEAALGDIVKLAEKGEHRAAAERAAGLLRQGSTDVRVLVHFLFGLFDANGPASLPKTLSILRAALSERWGVVRPEERRPRIVDSSLSWLFRTLVVNIDFHEKTKSPAFTTWASLDAATVGGPALEASAALREAASRVIDGARCLAQLSELDVRIRSHFNRLPVRPAPAPAPAPVADEEAAPPASEPEPDEVDDDLPGAAEPPPRPRAAPDEPPPHGRVLEISPAMEFFLRKLEAFERLVERGDGLRAALVADDIQRTLDSFDPRLYLPRLLARHFRLLAAHADELAEHAEGAEGPRWKALAQLYQVDLDAFLAE
ncbi:type VI secretion system protein IglI family protein [Polyangium aurulentum]|uniref:type VI secretion system protein IglI family protein n=1 Tax=Polyangium aurulentum TaxID=2567896 RepID=UPI0010ADCDA5|nr:type VI secretion system protein IglI family protein [Polyangium aurulentum]UQA56301.1 hypothetical protein E8A73_034035 [Polyangium aurulentum]